MTIGERIKYLRKNSGFTQEELSMKIGVKRSAIRKYEHDEIKNIPKNTIEIMAQVFNVTPAYIMGWDEPTNEPITLNDYAKWENELNSDGKLSKYVKGIEVFAKLHGDTTYEFLTLFAQLDTLDQGRIIGKIEAYLEADKYKK